MERRIYKSELDLLRWLRKRKRGCTVAEVIERYGGTRQSAYHRLERALAKEYLVFELERSDGPRERARYRIALAGLALVEQRWVDAGPRIMERRP